MLHKQKILKKPARKTEQRNALQAQINTPSFLKINSNFLGTKQIVKQDLASKGIITVADGGKSACNVEFCGFKSVVFITPSIFLFINTCNH